MNRRGPAIARRADRPHEVRLIGGRWRRSRLPVADRPGLRPTPDRVRETLFNWLGQDLAGWVCLDAFAGSGALGFEAASRGAEAVTLVERDPSLIAILHANVTRLDARQVAVVRADALAWMDRQPAGSFDLVFIDPPFEDDRFDEGLRAAVRLLAPEAALYLEADRPWPAADWAALGLRCVRHLKAGGVHAHLARPETVLATPGQDGRADPPQAPT